MTTTNIILTIAATTTALIAGLLYAYSCSVNIGLGRLADAEYISAMQSINKAIQNPLFLSALWVRFYCCLYALIYIMVNRFPIDFGFY